ncbi:MAG: hypothetical protein ACK4K0_09855 [Flavobacteriales bacterium]
MILRITLIILFANIGFATAQLNEQAKENTAAWIQRTFRPALKQYTAMDFFNFKTIEDYPDDIRQEIDSLKSDRFLLWKKHLLNASDTLFLAYKSTKDSLNHIITEKEKTEKVIVGYSVTHQFKAAKMYFYGRSNSDDFEFYEAEVFFDRDCNVIKTSVKTMGNSKKG